MNYAFHPSKGFSVNLFVGPYVEDAMEEWNPENIQACQYWENVVNMNYAIHSS